MSNKVTKRDHFNTLLTLADVQANPALVEFINHELELLDRKAENRTVKPTENQLMNAAIAERLPSLLEAGKWYRLSEIKALVPELAEASGTQRIAVICNGLVAEKVLERTVEKRVVYYSLAQ